MDSHGTAQASIVNRAAAYIGVALLWGITNPFLKRQLPTTSSTETTFQILISFLSDANKLLPFVINQAGSLLFYYLLANEPVTTASPICNSLTFAFTAVTAYILGERSQYPLALFAGVVCVLVGTYICFV